MQDIVSKTGQSLEWIEPVSEAGAIFRIGADVAYREGDRTLRIAAVGAPDADYRRSMIEAVEHLAQQWGGPVELVLEFVGSGPSGPGDSLALCRALRASGLVERMVVVKQPWMPALLLAAVTRVLSTSGMPFDIREVVE